MPDTLVMAVLQRQHQLCKDIKALWVGDGCDWRVIGPAFRPVLIARTMISEVLHPMQEFSSLLLANMPQSKMMQAWRQTLIRCKLSAEASQLQPPNWLKGASSSAVTHTAQACCR